MPDNRKIELGMLLKDIRSRKNLDRTIASEISDIHPRKMIAIEHGDFNRKDKGLIIFIFKHLGASEVERILVDSYLRRIFRHRSKRDAHRRKLANIRRGRYTFRGRR